MRMPRQLTEIANECGIALAKQTTDLDKTIGFLHVAIEEKRVALDKALEHLSTHRLKYELAAVIERYKINSRGIAGIIEATRGSTGPRRSSARPLGIGNRRSPHQFAAPHR